MMRIVFALLLVVFTVCQGCIVQRVVDCSSHNYQRATCRVKGAGSWTKLSVIDKISNSPCVEGVSYGFHGKSIWVDNGCRAKFQVFSCKKYRLQTCESHGNKYNTCNIHGAKKVEYMEVENQKSNTECTPARYGISGKQIWANDGCRASFHVCYC